MDLREELGFVGLGIMGSAMASNLLQACSKQLFVHNRTKAKAASLLRDGAVWCDSVEQVAHQARVICMCVTNDEASRSVVEALISALAPGSLVIDFSTISPSCARENAASVHEAASHYLDAPVSGGDVGARDGTLSVMVGGDRSAFERANPVFSCVGSQCFHTGDVGTGQLTKAVNQVVVAGTVAAMTEGLAFARDQGLDPELTLNVIRGGAAGSWSLEHYAPRVLRGDLGPGFRATDMLKDLHIALAEQRVRGRPLPVSELVTSLYASLCDQETREQPFGNHALLALYDAQYEERGTGE